MPVNKVLYCIVENGEKNEGEKIIKFYPYGYETIWVSRFEHFRRAPNVLKLEKQCYDKVYQWFHAGYVLSLHLKQFIDFSSSHKFTFFKPILATLCTRVDDEMEKEKMIMCEVRPPFPLLDRKRKKGRPLLARARFSLGNLFFMENYTCH